MKFVTLAFVLAAWGIVLRFAVEHQKKQLKQQIRVVIDDTYSNAYMRGFSNGVTIMRRTVELNGQYGSPMNSTQMERAIFDVVTTNNLFRQP